MTRVTQSVLAVFFLPLSALAQQKPLVEPQIEAVSAPALKYGAALEKEATPEVKDWVRGHVTKQMRTQAVDPKATMAKVDEQFAEASEEARDAVTFLVMYGAYRDEDENQRMLNYRIRDIDRETTEITRQLQVMWKNEQGRGASPLQGISAQERVRLDELQQKMESQLREYADERQLKATQEAASRKKAALYLKVLGMAYERMKGTEPEILRGVK
ncbi:MAG: hypothetical protein L0387_38975 [Acidobacteria bacterium]|nr:hypothetical protein [Acidobacteriota bacterium]